MVLCNQLEARIHARLPSISEFNWRLITGSVLLMDQQKFMNIQLNIQSNLVFAIIGALLFWQTMKLTYKHRSGQNFRNAISKPNFWKRDDFRSASKLYGEDLSSEDLFGTKLSGANLDGATMPDGTKHD